MVNKWKNLEVILAIPADDKILKVVDKLKEVSDDLTASVESFSNTVRAHVKLHNIGHRYKYYVVLAGANAD